MGVVQRKLYRLQGRVRTEEGDKSGFLTNISGVEIPPEVVQLLQLGPKFSLPPCGLPLLHLIADIEEVVGSAECVGRRDVLRADLVNILQNAIHGTSPADPFERRLREWMKKTAEFGREQGSGLAILQSDKGNRTVIMSRTEYDEKMRVLVQDTSTYEEISRDPTSRFQLRNNDLVRAVYNKEKINSYQKSQLTTYKAIAPRIYGLPKVHKPGVPLRPVVSYIGSPNYALAKFVASLLSPLTDSPYNVKNSLEVSRFVTGQVLPEGYIVVSLDVVSLFTNVPIDLVMSEIEVRFHEIEPHTPLEKSEVLQLAEFCLRSGYFTYAGKFYLQKDGVAMGSPIGPIAADIAMQKALNTILEDPPFRIGFVRKYVDDLLVSVHVDDVGPLMSQFNAFHPKIQFTVEKECEGVLPYLDLTIHRDATNTLSTVWYCKPNSSQRMLNYYSAHPQSTIINVGRNLIGRARLVTTKSGVNLDPVMRDILKRNDFPERIIRRLLRESSPQSGRSSPAQILQSERFFTLTYIKGERPSS
ncbi:uncharacterized protein LOC129808607 [Phlebotomus papatasi]|uniref:uncharacterized protein LOC129808607 n=1 Tax=Phlebotomus papatasi TaxID=29031 RepID=UPI0024834A4F|nr:uncharacterized protein LOC129808607 [Phlebotomus papatasi]